MYKKILKSLPESKILEVSVGLHWTAVVVDRAGHPSCGLATTLRDGGHHTGEPTIPEPGHLEKLSSRELSGWIQSEIPLRRSIGCAAINALLPKDPTLWVDQNAEKAILENGKGKKSVLIGHFPFADRLRAEIADFSVLDLNPSGQDLPASEAPGLLPYADLIAITGMTFINQTLPDLLRLCNPQAYVLVLGPSTPLCPVMGEMGVDLLAGSIVEDIPAVLAALSQGGNFRQIHKAGVRLITQLAS